MTAKGSGGRRRWLVVGAGGLVVVALAALGAIGLNLVLGPPEQAQPGATPTPAPSPTMGVSDVMDTLHGDCTACHVNPDGSVGTRPIPALAHPLKGWSQCTSCHAEDRLVATAAGHTGIHADQCLVCHKSETTAAAPRPHPEGGVGACLDCHGKTAPLPASMGSMSQTTCWLCHRSSEVDTPAIPHPLAGNSVCESCHVAGKFGALPDSHAGRADTTCIACHDIASVPVPAAPHPLEGLEGKCATCHGPGASPAVVPTPALPTPGGPGPALPTPVLPTPSLPAPGGA